MESTSKQFLLSERENNISFVESTHVYTINGKPHYISASKIISKYLYDEFDTAKYFQRKSPADERKERRDWAWIRERGTAIHLKIEQRLNKEEETTCTNFEWADEYWPLAPEEIDLFGSQVESAANLMFSYIEHLFGVENFLAAEYRIYGKIPLLDEEIPGTIDALFWKNKEKREVIMVDWKTNKKISSFTKKINNPKSPFHGTSVGKLEPYFCQLHIYTYILEKYYDVKVVEKYIFHYSPEAGVVSIFSPVFKCKCMNE